MAHLQYSRPWPYLLMLVAAGCTPDNGSPINPSASPCDPNAPIVLLRENIEFIPSLSQPIERYGTLDNVAIGYQFDGKAGDLLDYGTDPELCVFVFTQDNQLVTTDTLPKDGRYLVQIQPSGRKQNFGFYLSLERPNQFVSQSFPQSSCGDARPNNANLQSVQFYPVNISYSSDSLQFAITNYCRDAYQKTEPGTGRKLVQIASFLSQEKSQEFADFVNQRMNGAFVGQPTTIRLR